MESPITQNTVRDQQEDLKHKMHQDVQMTSSIVSTTSSLASPGDSGVQLLDSESEITSVMSFSGFGCDIDTIPNLESDEKPLKVTKQESTDVSKKNSVEKQQIMTKSDIDNQNVQHLSISSYSASVPNYTMIDKFFECSIGSKSASCSKDKLAFEKSLSDEVFEPEKAQIDNASSEKDKKVDEADLMNVSLNSYELLDYTSQNQKIEIPDDKNDPMHVSMSEEVNECLKISTTAVPESIAENPPADEQIVYRRQRKKKSKSDTPKKRVSFHEDILNSTKIDDIHINHGFITHEPDVSMSFFQRGFIRKPDVVKGRYSWAAEGDAPYYQRNVPERQINSAIYIHHPRFSSSSSSSSASISSSIDEEDSVQFDDSVPRNVPMDKKPKSSCLKKTKHKHHIDTNIVEEANLKKKESSLLDANIFGSLKNILSFSSSVPLAERGVPEGQEDVTVFSSSQDVSNSRRTSLSLSDNSGKSFEITSTPAKKVGNLNIRTNLKLTKSEGFYPNYPNYPNPNLPQNIVLCDSNVYEHKGISYSYEYDKFQKTFEQQNKPKSSTVYQMILKEFNFFKRKAKEEPQNEIEEDTKCSVVQSDIKSETSFEMEPKSSKPNINRYASSSKLDWSDNDTISDHTETQNSRHLNSPKHKIHKTNHYSIQPFKSEILDSRSETESTKSLSNLRPSSSKTSLINRFLRNVTLKKMLDMKAQKKEEFARKYLNLCVRDGKIDSQAEKELAKNIEDEVIKGQNLRACTEEKYGASTLSKFRTEIFRDENEILLNVSFLNFIFRIYICLLVVVF